MITGSISWHTVQSHFSTAKPEADHRRDTLDAFDHACRDGRQEQLGRIECVSTPAHVRIEHDFGLFAVGRAPMGVNPLRDHVVFQHERFFSRTTDCECGLAFVASFNSRRPRAVYCDRSMGRTDDNRSRPGPQICLCRSAVPGWLSIIRRAIATTPRPCRRRWSIVSYCSVLTHHRWAIMSLERSETSVSPVGTLW